MIQTHAAKKRRRFGRCGQRAVKSTSGPRRPDTFWPRAHSQDSSAGIGLVQDINLCTVGSRGCILYPHSIYPLEVESFAGLRGWDWISTTARRALLIKSPRGNLPRPASARTLAPQYNIYPINFEIWMLFSGLFFSLPFLFSVSICIFLFSFFLGGGLNFFTKIKLALGSRMSFLFLKVCRILQS